MHDGICITGIGIVSTLGYTKGDVWGNLINNKSGLQRINTFFNQLFKDAYGYPIMDFIPREHIKRKYTRPLDNVTLFSMAAVGKAIQDSGLIVTEKNKQRIAIVAGSMFHGIGSIFNFKKEYYESGLVAISPLYFPGIVFNSLSGQPAIDYGIEGPNIAVNYGAASGLFSIIKGIEYINAGHADWVIAGGAEMLHEFVYHKMESECRLADLSTNNRFCKPYDKNRNGILLGEGACFFVLEKEQTARERNTEIYGTIDAYNTWFIFSESECEYINNLAGCIQSVSDPGRTNENEIDLIIADGSGDYLLDKIEAEAIAAVFAGESPYITTNKGNLGHTLGASGAFNLFEGILVLHNNSVPPISHLDDAVLPLPFVKEILKKEMNSVMVNSLDFDGNAAVIKLSKPW